jgi:hypothetical protein
MSSDSGKTAKSEDLAIVGAFTAFVAVAFFWIWLFFGIVQPWLDRVLYGI